MDSPFRGHRDRRELELVRETCTLPPHLRSEIHIDNLMVFTKDVQFVQKLDLRAQRGLCRTMTLETFNPREYVFQMGDIGNKFYIILTGNVSVKRPTNENLKHSKDQHSLGKDKLGDMETVVFLDAGMGFGELALQNNDPRSATIQASELTELLVITKEDYDPLCSLHKSFINERCAFLRLCQQAEGALSQDHFSVQDIIALAKCLCEKTVQGRNLICRQGDAADRVIFLRKGQIDLIRNFDENALGTTAAVNGNPSRKAHESTSVCSNPISEMKRRERELKARQSQLFSLDTEIETPPRRVSRLSLRDSSGVRTSNAAESLLSLSKGPIPTAPTGPKKRGPPTRGLREPKKVLVRIGTLCPYQYFGDQEVLHNITYPVSLVSTCGAEFYLMTKKDMLRRLPKKLLLSFLCQSPNAGDDEFGKLEQEDLCSSYGLSLPPDNVSYHLSKQRATWNRFRQLLREDIVRRKQETRTHGQRSFRESAANGKHKVDIEANMEFMGMHPTKRIQSLVKMPAGGALSILRMEDLVYFSQENAHRLGRLRKLHHGCNLRPGQKDEFAALGNAAAKRIGECNNMFNYQTRRYWNRMSSGFTAQLMKLLSNEEELEVESADSSALGTDHEDEDMEEYVAETPRSKFRRNAMGTLDSSRTGRRSSDERRRSSVGDILRRELSKRRGTLLQSINQAALQEPVFDEKRKTARDAVRFQLDSIQDDDES